MAIAAAQIEAVVSVKGAQQAKQDLADTGKSAEQTKQSFGDMMKQGLANAASFAIFNVGAKAANFLKDQLVDTIQVAIQHQNVMSQTAQVIKSTGDASGMSAQSISDLAVSLSKVTPFSDDAIQSGQNLLLTFTGIGKDVFPATTKTMLDMAQAMGMDTKSAAMQLGKALNDPVQGMSALSREGVTFSDKQKEMIKHMVAVGNTAGAQKLMLKELQKEFGGSAEAAGKTFGGQLQILQNNLEDTKQKIGGALLPILGQLASNVSGAVLPAIQKFGDFLQSPAFQNFAKDVGQKVMSAFQSIGNVLKSIDWGSFIDDFKTLASDLAPIVSNLKPVASTLFNSVGGVLKNVVKDVGDFAKHVGEVVKWFEDGSTPAKVIEAAIIGIGIAIGLMKIGQFVAALPGMIVSLWGWASAQGAVAIATLLTALPYIAIGALVVGIVALIILAVTHWGDIVKWLIGAWAAVASFFEWLWGKIAGFFGGVGQWFQDRWKEAAKGTMDAFGAVGQWFQDRWKDIVNIFSGVGHWFSDRFHDAWNAITSIFGGIGDWFHEKWTNIVTNFSNVFNGISTIASNVFNSVIGFFKNGFNGIIDLVNGVIQNIDNIKVAGFGINIPLIPHLAEGGLIAQAGIALVGERGPEIVQLPSGARVIPNNQLGSSSSSSMQGGQVIHIHNYIDGKEITSNTMNRVIRTTRTSGPIRSNV